MLGEPCSINDGIQVNIQDFHVRWGWRPGGRVPLIEIISLYNSCIREHKIKTLIQFEGFFKCHCRRSVIGNIALKKRWRWNTGCCFRSVICVMIDQYHLPPFLCKQLSCSETNTRGYEISFNSFNNREWVTSTGDQSNFDHLYVSLIFKKSGKVVAREPIIPQLDGKP